MDFFNFINLMSILGKFRIAMGVIGTVGSILTFLVFSRKTFRKTSMSVYCRALAIVDLNTLLVLFNDVATVFYNTPQFFGNSYVCKLVLYLDISIVPISGWLLVLFSLDKLISVFQIEMLQFMKKKLNQILTLAAVVIAHLIFYSPILWYVHFEQINLLGNITIPTCTVQGNPLWKSYNILNLFDASLLPFSLMLGFSILTIYKLSTSRNNLGKFNSISRERHRKDRKFTFTSISMNVLFVLLQMSITISSFVDLGDYFSNVIFFSVSLMILQLDFNTRFFIYLMTNSIFRNEFKKMLYFQKSTNKTSILSTKFNTNRRTGNGSVVSRVAPQIQI
jgi:hypothetical protein